jgi:hypothetical protein
VSYASLTFTNHPHLVHEAHGHLSRMGDFEVSFFWRLTAWSTHLGHPLSAASRVSRSLGALYTGYCKSNKHRSRISHRRRLVGPVGSGRRRLRFLPHQASHCPVSFFAVPGSQDSRPRRSHTAKNRPNDTDDRVLAR